MASLFKPTIISYRDPQGHKCSKAQATEPGPDGKRVLRKKEGYRRLKTKSPKWYGRIRYPDGRVEKPPLFVDKAASQTRLAELLKNAEQTEVGIQDKYQDHRKRPLLEHLEDFRRYLEAKGNTPGYAQMTYTRAKAVIEGCKFERMRDMVPSKVVEYLGDLQKSGTGIATSNYYLGAVKSFGRWLMKDGRAPDNPLAHLSRQNAKTDVRIERRNLSPADFASFVEAARTGPAVFGLTGADRAMLYLVTANTGFRASEMASLTPESFDLDGEPPTVTVEAAYSKRKRKDAQPIRGDLAAMLREFLAGRPPAAPAWPAEQRPGGKTHHWAKDAAEMVRVDLEAAGIPYQDASGRVFDFHSLRHQFISNLAAAGVHPKEAQTLARHSTITLTMDRYTHIGLVDSAAALDKLPALPTRDKSEVMRATGTTGRDVIRPRTTGAKQAGMQNTIAIAKTTEDEDTQLPFPVGSCVEKKEPLSQSEAEFLIRRFRVRISAGVLVSFVTNRNQFRATALSAGQLGNNLEGHAPLRSQERCQTKWSFNLVFLDDRPGNVLLKSISWKTHGGREHLSDGRRQ